MKANELMCDDNVLHRGEPYRVYGVMVKADLVDLHPIHTRNAEGLILMPICCLAKDIDPIPLTEELLKANGFEDETSNFWKLRVDDKPHHYIFRLNKGGALCGDGYSMNCNIYTITIKYVHELQHALRLCGLNDLANNFKIE